MLKAERISLDSSGVLNPLVKDYLERKSSAREFYSYTPDPEGFSKALGEIDYKYLDRNLLKEILTLQSAKVKNSSAASMGNIERLSDPKTYTLTTGHQLCLFTGPLYFLYKIFSVINLASELNRKFPEQFFVPVYWMASEDHDFAEIDHFRLFGKELRWETDQKGSVGEFSTKDLEGLYLSFSEILGHSKNAEELKSLFKEAYLKHETLSDATRYLVNALFGEYGLVVVDGQDKSLKAQFREQFWTDLKLNNAEHLVSLSNKKLESKSYPVQVNPRTINSFYTIKGIRARFEKEGKEYKVVGTEIRFSEEQLKQELEDHPEHFSPNVVLRPLYQQHILPNLAYIGGPGELAYWLQYKEMFKDFKCFYPVLMPRNFVTLLEKPLLDKINKLGFTPEQMFQDENKLIKLLLSRFENKPEFQDQYKTIESLYDSITRTLSDIDKTLEGAARAEMQKAVAGLKGLEAKMNKALKSRSETEINQIKNIRQKLFPENAPQERVENFSAYFLRYGHDFFDTLKEELRPFDQQQILLCEVGS